MEEQKRNMKMLFMLALISLIISCGIEYWPRQYVPVTFFRGHRNFGVSLFLGLFSGALVSAMVSAVMYKTLKDKEVLNLANNLLGIKRCVKEVYSECQNFNDGMQEIRKLCNNIMNNPEILSLEREIGIEADFVNKLKDLEKGYNSKEEFLSRAMLIADFAEDYCLKFLKRNHMKTTDFKEFFSMYDIK